MKYYSFILKILQKNINVLGIYCLHTVYVRSMFLTRSFSFWTQIESCTKLCFLDVYCFLRIKLLKYWRNKCTQAYLDAALFTQFVLELLI